MAKTPPADVKRGDKRVDFYFSQDLSSPRLKPRGTAEVSRPRATHRILHVGLLTGKQNIYSVLLLKTVCA